MKRFELFLAATALAATGALAGQARRADAPQAQAPTKLSATEALFDSLDTAESVVVSVSDDKGRKVVGRALFRLDERKGFEALAAKARTDAFKAAVDPEKACKRA